jgi:hypothetical protein
MKSGLKYITVLIIILGVTIKAKSQNNFIAAGFYQATDTFHDIVPDTIFGCWHYYSMDINNDSTNDLKFSSFFQSSAGGFWGEGGVSIVISNGEILKDTLNSNFASILKLNDTIMDDTNWIGNTTLKISYYYWSQCPPLCPGYNYQINMHDTNRYIGYRSITLNDTLYGWIKISINGSILKVMEWAINKTTNNLVINNGYENIFHIYPNPATDHINVISTQNSQFEILNIQGQTIKRQLIQQGKTDIDISGLAKGVYILRLNSNDKMEVTKFVKE